MFEEAHLGQFGADSRLDFHPLSMANGPEGHSNMVWALALVNMKETFEDAWRSIFGECDGLGGWNFE